VNTRTRVAKTAYWLSGQLRWVKTYQRFYELSPPVDPGKMRVKVAPGLGEDLRMEPAGRHWFQCPWSTRLMTWSMRHDWRHWDHWALDHEGCEREGRVAVACPECGGFICPWDQEDEENTVSDESDESEENDGAY